jgi:hypothetical protein
MNTKTPMERKIKAQLELAFQRVQRGEMKAPTPIPARTPAPVKKKSPSKLRVT